MALIAFAGSCFAAAERVTLDKVFAEPPARSGINVWWHWQGANVTKYGITRDLESMKKAGVASATIFNIQDVGWDCEERMTTPLCPGMELCGGRDPCPHAGQRSRRDLPHG